MSYDVLIPFHWKDDSILPFAIQSIRQYAEGVKNIYVVSESDPEVEDCIWIAESSLSITKEDVSKYIHVPKRVGWYYQQILKLTVFDYLPTTIEHVLIWDSDLILRKPLSFFADGKICFALSHEYTDSYFRHMSRILPDLKRRVPYSGICHHMMISRRHLQEFLSRIEERHGKSAWMALLENVDKADHGKSGMSEYEMYFNYCIFNHENEYCLRPLIIDDLSSLSDINSSKAHMVAIHRWL
jgi:hypothetical protein